MSIHGQIMTQSILTMATKKETITMTPPKHVSWQIRDAWLCIPPCVGSEPYCHVDCPYFNECNPPEEPGSDDEQWDEYYETVIKKKP